MNFGNVPSPINERLKSKKSSENLFPAEGVGNGSDDDDEAVLLINGVKYVVKEKLGAGGSSSVFLAQSKVKNIECAIKVIHSL